MCHLYYCKWLGMALLQKQQRAHELRARLVAEVYSVPLVSDTHRIISIDALLLSPTRNAGCAMPLGHSIYSYFLSVHVTQELTEYLQFTPLQYA